MINAQEVQGQWDTLRGKVKEKWGHLTDDDLKIVGGNVDQVIGRIQQKTGEGRQSIEKFLNESLSTSTMTRAREVVGEYAQTASEYAQDAGERMREGYQQVRERAQDGYDQVEHMVQRRPAESMAVVFAAGLLTGVLVGMVLHMDDRR